MPEDMLVRRKRFSLPFGLGLLAGLAFGFAAGLAYLSFHQAVTSGALEDWQYPGATSTSTSGAGVGSPFGPPMMTRASMQTTQDSFEQVANHYAQRMKVSIPTSGTGSRASGDESVSYHADNSGPHGPRPVKSQAFARRERGGSVVVFITRADAEDETHILLYWLPRQ